jgi:hypothetical protein
LIIKGRKCETGKCFEKFYKAGRRGRGKFDSNNKITNKMFNWGVFTFNKTVIEAGKNGR